MNAFIKYFEAPQRDVKIKIQVNFFSLPGIETGSFWSNSENWKIGPGPIHSFNKITIW